MDAFVDAVAWYNCAFMRSGNGDFYRVWFEGQEPRMQRLLGDEAEWVEPLTELKRRHKAYGEEK